MHLETKKDLAVYYFVKDLFPDVDGIKIVDEFPTQLLELPTISIEASTLDASQLLQMGDTERIIFRTWYIDIFASNKAQRDEYAFRILDALEGKICVYNYDLGFPPQAIPLLGCLQPEQIRLEIIRILPELVDKLYYRSSISFTADYNPS